MKIIFLSFFILFSISHASIDSKIKNIKEKLSKNTHRNIKITQTLEELTNKIIRQKSEIERIKNKINRLRKEINAKRNATESSKRLLKQKNKKYKKLLNTRNDFNKKLTQIISQLIQLDLLENQLFTNDTSKKNLIDSYIYKSYSKVLKYNFREMEKKFFAVKIQIAKLEKEIKTLNEEQTALENKIANLQNLEELKKKKKELLASQKRQYKIKLSQVLRQNELLHRELQKSYKLKEKQNSIVLKEKNPNIKVKIYDKSLGKYFQRIPVVTYNGPKTIAPFRRYKIIRKFGKFVNPEYNENIPTYNPNIVLKPIGSKNVRNIFKGKVLSIVQNPTVGKLVLMGYKDGIHILYANLSSISKIVKKGRILPKKAVLGKVSDKLILEVTKNGANIDPTQLIK